MKSLFITFLSFLFLSGCALYSGIKDQSEIKPAPKPNGTTISTPPPERTNPASAEQNQATTTAGKIISPVTH